MFYQLTSILVTSPIKCHSESMDDNRDSTVLLHQEISSLIRLLSLFVYIMNKTGTAVNKVKPLLKS